MSDKVEKLYPHLKLYYNANPLLLFPAGWELETSGGSVTLIRDAGSPSINSRAYWQKTAPRNEASSHESWKYVAEVARTVYYFDYRRPGGVGKSFSWCLLGEYLPQWLEWFPSAGTLAS